MPPSVAAPESDPSQPVVVIRPLAEHRRFARPSLELLPETPEPPPPPPPGPRESHVRWALGRVLEVLDGRRPRTHLTHLVPSQYEAAIAAHISPGCRTLGKLHLIRTAPDIIDLCSVIHNPGRRSRAITGRLVLRNYRWDISVLALV